MGAAETEHDRWVEKVQKLLAKAERAGTPEEAETFFAKAQELMTKHAIDELALKAAGRSQDEITTERFDIPTTCWKATLSIIQAAGDANDVSVVYGDNGGSRPYIYLTGFLSDVRSARMLFDSLMTQCTLAEKTAVKAAKAEHDDYWDGPFNARIFKQSFRVGFARSVSIALEAARATTVKVAEENSGSLLPMIVEKKELVDEAVSEQFPRLKTSTHNFTVEHGGYRAGVAAGDRADVGRREVSR